MAGIKGLWNEMEKQACFQAVLWTAFDVKLRELLQKYLVIIYQQLHLESEQDWRDVIELIQEQHLRCVKDHLWN